MGPNRSVPVQWLPLLTATSIQSQSHSSVVGKDCCQRNGLQQCPTAAAAPGGCPLRCWTHTRPFKASLRTSNGSCKSAARDCGVSSTTTSAYRGLRRTNARSQRKTTSGRTTGAPPAACCRSRSRRCRWYSPFLFLRLAELSSGVLRFMAHRKTLKRKIRGEQANRCVSSCPVTRTSLAQVTHTLQSACSVWLEIDKRLSCNLLLDPTCLPHCDITNPRFGKGLETTS